MRKMKIEIDLPRPGLALAVIAAVTFGSLWLRDSGMLSAQVTPTEEVIVKQAETEPALKDASDQGGDALLSQNTVKQAEEKILATRSYQAILAHKEEYLRYQLKLLEEERKSLGDTLDAETEEQFRQSTLALMQLLQDEKSAEQYVLSSLNQIWQSQGRSTVEGSGLGSGIAFEGFSLWPVNPEGGISAKFHDAGYRKIFSFEHDAIDLRVLQGTTIRSPGAGRVIEVKDQNGLGFNYLRIEHEEGIVTLYGHIMDSLVEEGEYVKAGQAIAKSGGMPGTKGAGAFTTGAHLHFRLDIDGVPVDPTPYLPK